MKILQENRLYEYGAYAGLWASKILVTYKYMTNIYLVFCRKYATIG